MLQFVNGVNRSSKAESDVYGKFLDVEACELFCRWKSNWSSCASLLCFDEQMWSLQSTK